ncbi:MAG TPA: hypothetical protein VEH77_04905 [Roseiarcus sp.]|nr:hypothetical protein [Roseiarcus sp.]
MNGETPLLHVGIADTLVFMPKFVSKREIVVRAGDQHQSIDGFTPWYVNETQYQG